MSWPTVALRPSITLHGDSLVKETMAELRWGAEGPP